MQKTINIISYLTILTAILLTSLVFILELYPYPVSNYIQWTTPVNIILNKDHIIKRGDTIKWQVNVEILQPFTSETSRFLMSDTEGCNFGILQTTTMVAVVGNRQYVNSNFIVPKDFKPCVYYVRLTNKIKVNPIRTIEFNRDTEKFTVI